ncbi:hypothetical protein U14_05277 [Candidatus Moduliflexus flocculans]|uniref:Lipoprotein n=1 Tax=Candidatus Moduliflexus flocculans TaxID=1499966 RepID=A0A081BRG9_9BACT|nr:hypothetical protein U14_05277 [Candidatus Moduliflexus flocculans]
MKRQFIASMTCCFLVLFIGVSGCSNSSDSDTKVVRTGQTSAGRHFSVIEDGGKVNLLIDGESVMTLGSKTPQTVYVDTIQVIESGGTPNLLHIDWDGDSNDARGYRNQRNYYLVVPAGKATTVLIKGNNSLNFYNGMNNENGSGSYQLTFEGSKLRLVENEVSFNKTDTCYKEEKRLTREFEMTSATAQLTYCQEEYRTTTLALDRCAEIDNALQNAPWAWANLSEEVRGQKCPAIR